MTIRDSGIGSRLRGKHYCGHRKDPGPKIGRKPPPKPEEWRPWDARVAAAIGSADRLAALRAEQNEMIGVTACES